MNYNSKKCDNKYAFRKQQNMLTTKVTSTSFEFNTHFLTVFERVIQSKTLGIKQSVFESLKNCNKMDAEVTMFVNHCATIIQSRFKGYQQRKYYRMFLPILWRFKQLLGAVVAGWRIRRILKTNTMRKRCNTIRQQLKRNNLRDARIMKRQLLDEINRVSRKGKWVQQQQVNKTRNMQIKSNKKIILRSVLKISSGMESGKQSGPTTDKDKTYKRGKQSSYQTNTYKQEYIQRSQNIKNGQQQIPIKATGFYNIPTQVQPIDANPTKTEERSQNKRKQKLSVHKKVLKQNGVKNSNTEKQEKIGNIADIEQKYKQEPHNLSNLSIHLPIDQEYIQEVPLPHKTMKLDINKFVSSARIQDGGSLGQTQKIKKIGKGIKVTLCSSVKQVVKQQQMKQEMKQGMKQVGKQVEQVVQYVDQAGNKQEGWDGESQLSQILRVYSGVYQKKRRETEQKYKEMKGKNKFLH